MSVPETEKPVLKHPKIRLLSSKPSGIVMCIYGESGVGKTTLASEAPGCLYADAENGLQGLAESRPDLHVWPIQNWQDLEDLYMFLTLGGHGYESVVLDPMNMIQRISLNHVLMAYPKVARPYGGSLASQGDWGKSMDDLTTLMLLFSQQLGNMNVVFTCLAQSRDKDEDFVKPWLRGKNMSDTLMAACGVVGYLYTKPVEGRIARFLQLQPFGNVDAKDRYNKLPATMEDPTFDKILTAIKGGHKKTEE